MQKYKNNVQDTFGNAVSGVTVTIRDNPGGGLSTIFSDNSGTSKTNPFTNDSDGEFFFYAADGRYDIELTGPVTENVVDIRLLDITTSGTSLRVNTDIVTATPPTTEAVTGNYQIWDLDNSDQLARFGFEGTSTLYVRNLMHGAVFRVTGEDAGGVARILYNADPDGASEMYNVGTRRIDAHSTGRARVYSDDNLDASQRTINFCFQDETVRAQVGNIGSVETRLRSLIHGAAVVLDGEDAGGTLKNIFRGDPDGGANVYHGGLFAIGTGSSGSHGIYSAGNTDTESRLLGFLHQNVTRRGYVGHNAAAGSELRLVNEIHGGPVVISGEDAGGTLRTILNADPDSLTILNGDTGVLIETVLGSVSLDWNGQINFRTSDDAAADIGMGAEIRHNDDVFYPVGMNVVPEEDALDTANETLALDNVGKMLTYNSATARSLLMNNDANIKVGSMWSLLVGPSAGTLTGDGGTGVQIRWWNGTGWTTTAAAGNITIGVGQYTIWKETDTLYHISGPTLS